jgi:HD-GYP domain-containing protein (c-di-GMP phosphodiesterase class II)
MPVDDAVEELRRNAGTQFDAVVVDLLISDIQAALGAYDDLPIPSILEAS